MKSADVREKFLTYFQEQGHEVVASSSLVPGNDPTLLFTNAGMVQFKDVFLGDDKRSYSRATTSQRCVRAGGKHNDLENVGYTARHHTFFEMLGNFSFGDYFKRDAIKFAWQFLTEVLGLPPEKLWVTVHISDDEAEKIWKEEMGIDPTRFSKLDEDNFWQMGDTGPCGPSSEIFYDHGDEVPGGPPGSENDDLDRYIEIWNLVFMQYERQPDGELKPLPKPSVDTGMGLERIAAVMQNVHNNYDIDLFKNLLDAVSKVTGNSDAENMSRRVIADHIRSCAFLIVDGVLPSNEGRGYVLRRIIRRAVRHGHKLGKDEPFFHQLVNALVKEMGEAYPELANAQAQVEKVLLAEEEQFARTLDKGMGVLEEQLASIQGEEIPGDLIFLLYDTYGFPVDLTNDIARERDLTLDMPGYEACMEEQRERARSAGKFSVDYSHKLELDSETEFTGYEKLSDKSTVVALLRNGEVVEQLNTGEQGAIVTDKTPFYAESGGQVGDAGLLQAAGCEFAVQDTQKSHNNFLHTGELITGSVTVGDTLTALVDEAKRKATAFNHSATHLLHAALRTVLGDHVQQKGSLVDEDKLRFDFSHFEAVTEAQLRDVERLVNEQIVAQADVTTTVTSMDEAQQLGAMALFGEKYGESVRVLAMGEDNFSVELCGGTHVNNTGDIALFRLVSESGIASGVRRVEGVTGKTAYDSFVEQVKTLSRENNSLCDELKALQESLESDNELPVGSGSEPAVDFDDSGETALIMVEALNNQLSGLKQTASKLQQYKKLLDKKAAELEQQQNRSLVDDELISKAKDRNGVKCLVAQFDHAGGDALRAVVDMVRNNLGTSVVFLASVDGDKVQLVAGVTKDATDRIKAGDLMREVAPLVGGKGGGRPDMAQGGGTDPAGLDKALERANSWIIEQLS